MSYAHLCFVYSTFPVGQRCLRNCESLRRDGLVFLCPRQRQRTRRRVSGCYGGPAAIPGTTYLVGSGPGGVDHLTFRAARLIATADVLVADALADDAVVNLRRADSRLLRVGKRGGDAESVPQSEISALLVSLAREDPLQSVVRLKSGDPGIFGRATEELAALNACGSPVCIVPGVSSVNAAAAACGLSLTGKDLGRNLVIVSGHDADAIDYDALARLDTVAILMAGGNLAEILSRLSASCGSRSRRSASAVQWAMRADKQRIVHGNLDCLAERVKGELPGGLSPGVVLLFRTS